jgi:hypothetical protein
MRFFISVLGATSYVMLTDKSVKKTLKVNSFSDAISKYRDSWCNHITRMVHSCFFAIYAIIQTYRKEKSRSTRKETDKLDLRNRNGETRIHKVVEEEEIVLQHKILIMPAQRRGRGVETEPRVPRSRQCMKVRSYFHLPARAIPGKVAAEFIGVGWPIEIFRIWLEINMSDLPCLDSNSDFSSISFSSNAVDFCSENVRLKSRASYWLPAVFLAPLGLWRDSALNRPRSPPRCLPTHCYDHLLSSDSFSPRKLKQSFIDLRINK